MNDDARNGWMALGIRLWSLDIWNIILVGDYPGDPWINKIFIK